MTGRDIGVIIFLIVLLISAILNNEDILFAFTMFMAFSIVAGTVIGICSYFKKYFNHKLAVLVVWCFLAIFTGPLAYIFHEIIYRNKKKKDIE